MVLLEVGPYVVTKKTAACSGWRCMGRRMRRLMLGIRWNQRQPKDFSVRIQLDFHVPQVFKWQEGFWQIMKEVFDADYKAASSLG